MKEPHWGFNLEKFKKFEFDEELIKMFAKVHEADNHLYRFAAKMNTNLIERPSIVEPHIIRENAEREAAANLEQENKEKAELERLKAKYESD